LQAETSNCFDKITCEDPFVMYLQSAPSGKFGKLLQSNAQAIENASW